MNLEELEDLARTLARDKTTTPYLWPSTFIVQALNDAQWEACRRARLIIDSTTPVVCRITLAAGAPSYPVHESVIFIRRAKLSTRAEPLGFARVRDMDEHVPDWEAETGEVVGWVADYTTGRFRPYRIPTAAEVPASVTLTVVRGPLKAMKEAGDKPEIHPRFHYNLVHWALFRMYSVHDSQTYNPKKAAEHAALFAAEFGPPSPAIEEQWIDRNFDYAADSGVF